MLDLTTDFNKARSYLSLTVMQPFLPEPEKYLTSHTCARKQNKRAETTYPRVSSNVLYQLHLTERWLQACFAPSFLCMFEAIACSIKAIADGYDYYK